MMMARANRIYILMIKVKKLFSFFSSRSFLEEIKNMFSVFLSSYRDTRESLGELEKAVETLACGSCSHSISRSKLPLEKLVGRICIAFENSLNPPSVKMRLCKHGKSALLLR